MITPSAGKRHVHHRDTIRHHLLLKVSTLVCFEQRDVESNGGIFLENDDEKPPELQQLEARLTAMRSYDCGDDNLEYPFVKSSEPFFSRCYFRKTEAEDQAKVKILDELISFNRLIEYFPDYFRYLAPSTTSLLKRSFLLSAFCMDTIAHDHMELVERVVCLGMMFFRLIFAFRDMPFRFSSFISCDGVYPESRQDAPISDFAVCFRPLGLPFVIGHIYCHRSLHLKNRFSMLSQAIAYARVGHYLLKSNRLSNFFVIAIYLSPGMIAHRHIVMKTGSETDEVYITHKTFRLNDKSDAAAFFVELHNLASEIEAVFPDLDETRNDELELRAAKNVTARIKSQR